LKFACRKCRQPYELALIIEITVWMAVPPWSKSLCAACDIDAVWQRR
jgi:hypothetical protein